MPSIRDKSIRFQHEMHKRRRRSHELATDRTGQHERRLKGTGLSAALDWHNLLRIEPVVDPISQCCISFVREPISASGPCFL